MIENILIKRFKEFNKKSQEDKDALPHVNCCQHTLTAADQAHGLNWSSDVMVLAQGFGGGMKIQSVCGALTGGVMVLSKKFYGHENLETIIQDYFQTFTARHGSIMCDALKEEYYEEEIGCQKVITLAGKVLDEAVERVENGYE